LSNNHGAPHIVFFNPLLLPLRPKYLPQHHFLEDPHPLFFPSYLSILVRIVQESIAFDILPSPQNGVVLQVSQAVDVRAVTTAVVTKEDTLANKDNAICSMGLLLVY